MSRCCCPSASACIARSVTLHLLAPMALSCRTVPLQRLLCDQPEGIRRLHAKYGPDPLDLHTKQRTDRQIDTFAFVYVRWWGTYNMIWCWESICDIKTFLMFNLLYKHLWFLSYNHDKVICTFFAIYINFGHLVFTVCLVCRQNIPMRMW